ncbi:mannitol-1-phosphate 5-dehydrogenase [Halobacillus litoralis]|uniref:mannitol-1-phosphate 5-dehydrogenase n=1 Tax=Halobacillus litoralis TaxID=45668 RepID=UPI001CFC8F53|nr:mannitol-1-phosphate 5-dehydrogenase [Halobacillus litoralis]
MKALHFGAGNIGRGLIGNLLNKTGFDVCFVDADLQLVESINQRGEYRFEILDENRTLETISPARALHSRSQEDVLNAIVEADVITTSVGVNNLSKIAPVLSEGLLKRIHLDKPKIDIIANENSINASSQLKSEIESILTKSEMDSIRSSAGFPNSAIDRLSLSEDRNGEQISLVEPYYEWMINRSEMKNEDLPRIQDATYVEDLKPYIERKLYMVNMGHAATAYFAFVEGYPTIQRALRNAEMEEFLRSTLHESARYFTHAYSFETQEMSEFIEKTIDRFKNEHISDDIFRVGRAPIRKLGSEERLIKPIRTLFELGLPIDNLTAAAAAGFLFHNPEDEEAVMLQNYIEEHGIEQAIEHFTRIKEPAIVTKINDHYFTFKMVTSQN